MGGDATMCATVMIDPPNNQSPYNNPVQLKTGENDLTTTRTFTMWNNASNMQIPCSTYMTTLTTMSGYCNPWGMYSLPISGTDGY